jgi:MFS family permease
MREVFALPNIRWFILFRLLFNARFYYPVFTVLFLDMGITLEQFFFLNAVWAATIIVMEVPSGAFADTFGRRNLVVLAGFCMIIEIALIAFLPLGAGPLVFAGLLANRIISGFAESMASGADEALAYDTLKQANIEESWPVVLDLQMRIQSAAFVFTMLVGALVYDARALNWILENLGFAGNLTPEQTLRFPLYLCLITACFALWSALRMVEVSDAATDTAEKKTAKAAFQKVVQTGRWVMRTPVVLMILAAALTFDSMARIVITLVSEYYRTIQIPESVFGVMGAVMGVMGLFIPVLARRLVQKKSPVFNWTLLALVLAAAVIGMSFMIPYWGVIPAMGISATLMLVNFFSSHYLNRSVEDSRRRATVLSFRSLVSNLAYGATGLVYMGFTAILRRSEAATPEHVSETGVFSKVIVWTPLYYLLTVVVLLIFLSYIQRWRRGE